MGFGFHGGNAEFCGIVICGTALLAWLFVRARIELLKPLSAAMGPLVLALLVGAFQEEVVFRGFIVSLLRPSGWMVALTVSTVLFTVVHFVTSKVTWHQGIRRR